jgi:hypothetical protein
MSRIHNLFLLFIFISANKISVAQHSDINNDSVKIYRKIENYSKKTKTTKLLYKYFFRSVAPEALPNDQHTINLRKSYTRFENKIIRHIYVVTMDPFGNDFNDSTRDSKFIAGNFLNEMHVNTLPITIRNLLLIKKDQSFDSVLVRESERLVRKQTYIREVYFNPVLCGTNSDSVDIQIKVKDYWTIIPGMAASPAILKLKLSDKNLAGLGHHFANSYTWDHKTGKNAFETSYIIPNFQNTYISTELNYTKDEQDNYRSGISIDRPFYSALARWAGGVSLSKQSKLDTIYESNTYHFLFPTKFISQDYWVAESWQMRKGRSEDNRTTNLILSARFLNLNYLDRINELASAPNKHDNTSLFLAGLGLSTRKYVQDNFIFNFGKTEDVPIGRTYGLVGGYQLNGNKLFYFGANFSYGNYYPWGYLRNNIEYGTLFNTAIAQQGTLKAELNYNTKLIELGDWNFRQFIKSSITIGIKRLQGEKLTINEGLGINGFNSTELTGIHKFLCTFQTQAYAPGNILGFQFGPYLLISLGMLGQQSTGFRNSRVYSQLGIGTLIRNKFLIINTFQLSFSFYPAIPGNGNDIFKINSFKSNDFGFLDFDFGKPGMVIFQ